MTPAVPDPTVEALLAEHDSFTAHGGLHSDDWQCACGFVFTAPGSTPQGKEVHRTHLARILAARAAAPDTLRDRLQALCDAAMRNKWHLGTNHVDVPVRDLLAALEETK